MRLLHVGCAGRELPEWLKGYDEVRLDINPEYKPDIVASMTDMGEIGQFEVVYTAHCLEHLYPYDVPKALGEFIRVLAPAGGVVIFVSDLEGIEPTDEVVYESARGPITGRDMFYGYGPDMESHPYMAHHTGFVAATLKKALTDAGFVDVVATRLPNFNLMAAGRRAH